jgi:hypothetical protein
MFYKVVDPGHWKGFPPEESQVVLMGIRCYCPNGHKLNLKSHLAGQRGICPECGVPFVIPDPNAPTNTPSQPATNLTPPPIPIRNASPESTLPETEGTSTGIDEPFDVDRVPQLELPALQTEANLDEMPPVVESTFNTTTRRKIAQKNVRRLATLTLGIVALIMIIILMSVLLLQ